MKKTNNVNLLKSIAKRARRKIIKISHKANVGHIGSSLSITDILTVIYYSILNVDSKNPYNPSRDRFILSKGHAALTLYITLQSIGFFSKKFGSFWCILRCGRMICIRVCLQNREVKLRRLRVCCGISWLRLKWLRSFVLLSLC